MVGSKLFLYLGHVSLPSVRFYVPSCVGVVTGLYGFSVIFFFIFILLLVCVECVFVDSLFFRCGVLWDL